MLLALLLLAVAPAAQAGSLAHEGTELVYRSAPGEADEIVIQPGDPSTAPGKLFVHENGRPVELGVGCARGRLYPECSSAGLTGIRVLAGDGDDRIVVLGELPVSVDLGPGDDKVTARGHALALSGGDGRDELTGETAAGTIDAGAGDDTILVHLNYAERAGPLLVAGGEGDDGIEIDGHARPGVTLSGGAGDDRFTGLVFGSGHGMDVSCGPGADRTELRLADRFGDGCAPMLTAFDPNQVSRAFREGTLAAPGRVEIVFRRRPGGGRRPAQVLARGAANRPAGAVRVRLKTTKAGRRWLRPRAKLYVFVTVRAGGDRNRVRFDSRLER